MKSRALFASILIVLMALTNGRAQQDTVDSLKYLLETSLTPQQHVDVLCELALNLYDKNDSLAFTYSLQALSEANELSYKEGQQYANIVVGIRYYLQGEYPKALSYLTKSINIRTGKSSRHALYGRNLIGNIYQRTGLYDSASLFYNQVLKTPGVNKSNQAMAYRGLASVYLMRWENEKVIVMLNRADSIITRGSPNLHSLYLYGKVYENLLDYQKAENYFSMLCTQAKGANDYYALTQCMLSQAVLDYRKGDFSEALKQALAALNSAESRMYVPLRASIYALMADVYVEFSQYDLAVRYYLEALKITERLHLRNETADIYSSLAWVNKDQFNFKQAHEYVDKSEKLRQEIGDRYGLSNSYSVRGLILLTEKKYSEAEKELNRSIALRKEIKHTRGVSASIYNLSLVYEARGDIESALKLQLEAMKLEEQFASKQDLAITYNSIASLYLKKRSLSNSLLYLDKARALGEQTRSKLLMRNNLGIRAQLYELQGDYKAAYKAQKQYQELNDSIYSEGSSVKLAEMQALFQVAQKDNEIQLLTSNKLLQENQLQTQRSKILFLSIAVVAGVLVFVLVLILALKTYRYNQQMKISQFEIIEQKEEIQTQAEELTEANQSLMKLNTELQQKTEAIHAQSVELKETNEIIVAINRDLDDIVEKRTKQLQEAYKELDTFFYRASHDFRRPLTTFMGLAEVAKVTVKDQHALELFERVRETARSLDKMLVKLQSISDVGANELVFKEVLIREIFDSVCISFEEEIKQHRIRVLREGELKDSVVSYPAMVRIIIENLVENAIQFSGGLDPYLKFKIRQVGSSCEFCIEDNGPGIPESLRQSVFDMYFRGSERSKGNGLGLYIVKKAVAKVQGLIELTESPEGGCCFKITLPLHMEEFRPPHH